MALPERWQYGFRIWRDSLLSLRKSRAVSAGPGARSCALQWLMLQVAGFGPAAGQAIHFTALATEDAYARKRFTIEIKRLVEMLDRRPTTSAFVGGDEYSIADIAFYPWMRILPRFFPESRTGHGVARWYAEIEQRPAAQRMKTFASKQTRLDRSAMQGASTEALDRYFGRMEREQ